MPNKQPFVPPHEQSQAYKSTAASSSATTHKCPLGVIINPWWLRVVGGLLSAIVVVVWVVAQSIYSSYASMTGTVQAHQLLFDAIKQADLPNRVVRIEVVQEIQGQALDRVDTKLDKILEVSRIPNPAPKP